MYLCIMRWTKDEIQAYKRRCFENFYGIGGNQPLDALTENYSFPSYEICNAGERFALSANPLSLCEKIVEPDIEYEVFTTYNGEFFAKKPDSYNSEYYICPSDDFVAPVQGISFYSTKSGKKYVKPLITFVRKIERYDGDGTPHGDVNKYLLKRIKEVKPYITIRELLEDLIEYIGDNESYFTVEHWQILNYGICDRYMYNCHLANNKTTNRRFNLD